MCMLHHALCVCRCYAALGDVPKVRYLREVGKLADKMSLETVSYTYSIGLYIQLILTSEVW